MMDEMYERRMNFKLNVDTLKYASLEIIDNDIYGLTEYGEYGNAIYKVNTLESIGWNDPFPKDIPQRNPKNEKKKPKFKVETRVSKYVQHITLFDQIQA